MLSTCARGRIALAALLLLPAAGCSAKLYPVRGKVTLADGKPLTEGMVVFESKAQASAVTARGELRADGSYELSTHQPGDGVLPGEYKVLVAAKTDPNAVDKAQRPPPFDPRYMDFSTSGLEFEVTAGGANDFAIKLDRHQKTK